MFSEATRNFIRQNRFRDVKKLALSVNNKDFAGIDLSEAMIQIAGRQSVEKKLPSWYENDDIIYPRHLPLEQCSSEWTARYKASVVSGTKLVDLTGGFGVDCAFISGKFGSAIYVERQKALCDIAGQNFRTLHLDHIQVVNDDAENYLNTMPPAGCIYLDPARRNHSGKKIIAISDCEPNLNALRCVLLEKSDCLLVKLSPMLDIHLALQSLPETSEIHIVSVDNECKELLFLLKKEVIESPMLVCVDLKKNGMSSSFSFRQQEEKDSCVRYSSGLQQYLYEPNSSVLKAGAYKSVALKYDLEKLHVDSHLYTSDSYKPDFPGRVFEIETMTSFNKSELKSAMKGTTQANLGVRNFPASADELKKKLKLQDGGSQYLFATTLADGKKVLLLCRKMQ
ncbi:MAG: class I SAM-dependent methyltransferase [Dysgonamonadaceae bacterium]|jgi:protein-L-isoaspartate O-methyltransferase|nr:class I SAM-dependent methyltransferase [Dysgonamonadaceae bacterium]